MRQSLPAVGFRSNDGCITQGHLTGRLGMHIYRFNCHTLIQNCGTIYRRLLNPVVALMMFSNVDSKVICLSKLLASHLQVVVGAASANFLES